MSDPCAGHCNTNKTSRGPKVQIAKLDALRLSAGEQVAGLPRQWRLEEAVEPGRWGGRAQLQETLQVKKSAAWRSSQLWSTLSARTKGQRQPQAFWVVRRVRSQMLRRKCSVVLEKAGNHRPGQITGGLCSVLGLWNDSGKGKALQGFPQAEK